MILFNNGTGTTTATNQPGATTVAAFGDANGVHIDGRPTRSTGTASASLDRGELKASVSNMTDTRFGTIGSLGRTDSWLADTIFFTNNSGTAQTVRLNLGFDGRTTVGSGATIFNTALTLRLQCSFTGCFNNEQQSIAFAGGPNVGFDTITANFSPTRNTIFQTPDGDIPPGQSTRWLTTLNARDGADGWSDGMISTFLTIPTGATSLGFNIMLTNDCRGQATCDFGNSAALRIGALPGGVSFGSASGVLLSGLGTGAIPEPASWAMLIAGFGLVGAAARRQRRAAA